MAADRRGRLSTGQTVVTSSSRASQPAVPETSYSYLLRARTALAEAATATEDTRRYAMAHVAALRTTAAMLAARTRPSPTRGQRNAWVLLARVVPELEEWAVFFAAGAGKRAAAEAGLSRSVSTREADDLVRAAEQFLDLVERMLGIAHQHALPA